MEFSGEVPSNGKAALVASLYSQAGIPPEPIPLDMDETAFRKAVRSFAEKARLTPHSESDEEWHRKINSLLRAAIDAELRDIELKSGTNWAASAAELARTYDNRLLFQEVLENAPDKIKHLVLEKRPVSREPVRRIALCSGILRKGGSQRCASLLMQQFVRQGKKVLLLANEPRNPLDYPCPPEVKRVVLPTEKDSRMFRMETALKEFQADTCLCLDHTSELMFYDLLTARALGIRTVAMEHSTFSHFLYGGDPEVFFTRNTVYRACDAVTCLSGMDRQLWADWGVNACFMPNPLTFDPHSSPLSPLDTKTLILIARLSPNKGVEPVLEVLGLVQKKHPDARLFLLGEFVSDEYRDLLIRRIQESGLENAVLLPGYTNDVSHYLKKSSLLLMPSVVEGFPMTLMEAKAYGVPAVCFEMEYLEAAGPDMGCVQVGKEDVLGMARTVIELFDEPHRLKQLGIAAHASLEHFGNETVERRWNALFSYLETGNDPKDLFRADDDAETQLLRERLAGKEFCFGLDVCLNNRDFIARQRQLYIKRYLEETPFMHHAYKLKLLTGELFPEDSAQKKILFPVFRQIGRACGWCLNGLRSLYRKFRPWRETKNKEL